MFGVRPGVKKTFRTRRTFSVFKLKCYRGHPCAPPGQRGERTLPSPQHPHFLFDVTSSSVDACLWASGAEKALDECSGAEADPPLGPPGSVSWPVGQRRLCRLPGERWAKRACGAACPGLQTATRMCDVARQPDSSGDPGARKSRQSPRRCSLAVV